MKSTVVALGAVIVAGCAGATPADAPSPKGSSTSGQEPVTQPSTPTNDEDICSLLEDETGARVLVRLVLERGLLSEAAQAHLRHAVTAVCPDKADEIRFLEG